MNKYKIINILTVFILLLTIETSLTHIILTPKPVDAIINIDLGKKISTKLIAEVYDSEGKLKQRIEKDNDLITNQFRNFLINAVFTTWVSGQKTMSMTDITNTARTLILRDTSGSGFINYLVDGASGIDNKGGYMGIGSGTNSPLVTDYSLQTAYDSQTAMTGGYPTWTTGTGDITFNAVIPITGSINISEGCLYTRWLPSAGTTTYYFMMTRDTFTPISCVNGDTFSLTIIINLSGEFNNNFGNFIKGIFQFCTDGNVLYISMLDTNNVAQSIRAYTTAYSDYQWCRYIGSSAGGSSYMTIGTGAGALLRTSYILNSQVETATAIIPVPYISSNNIILVADILCSVDRSIAEIGYFTEFSYYSDCLMIRELISPTVDIVAGHSARVLITITL